MQFPDDVGAVVDRLATAESRKRAGMVKRLALEALAARGEWDLERNAPPGAKSASQNDQGRAGVRRPDSLIGIVRQSLDRRSRGTLYILKDGSVHIDPNFIEALRLPPNAFTPFRHEDWTILNPDGSFIPTTETPFARVRRGLYSAPRMLGGRYKDGPVIWMIVEGRVAKSGAVIRYVSVTPDERPCATCDAMSCFTSSCSHEVAGPERPARGVRAGGD